MRFTQFSMRSSANLLHQQRPGIRQTGPLAPQGSHRLTQPQDGCARGQKMNEPSEVNGLHTRRGFPINFCVDNPVLVGNRAHVDAEHGQQPGCSLCQSRQDAGMGGHVSVGTGRQREGCKQHLNNTKINNKGTLRSGVTCDQSSSYCDN